MGTASRTQAAAIAAAVGSTLLPDNDQWVNRFTVRSTTSRSLYTVAQRRTDAVWGCSCPGWRHRRYCKHVTDLLARLTALDIRTDVPEIQAMLASARTTYLDLGGAAGPATPQPTIRNLDLE